MARGGYFAAIGLPMRRGEAYPERWTPGAPRLAVVNERFVRLYFGGRDPVGRELSAARGGEPGPRFRIVGVVGDLRTSRDEATPSPAVYVPPGATYWPLLHFAASSDHIPTALPAMVRALASELAADDVVVEAVQPLYEHTAASLREPRLRVRFVAVFAGAAVLLAGIGLYGLLAGEVAARAKAIGIQLALGASPMRVLSGTLDRGLRPALAGLLLGSLAVPLAARGPDRSEPRAANRLRSELRAVCGHDRRSRIAQNLRSRPHTAGSTRSTIVRTAAGLPAGSGASGSRCW
jgi:putative ABC transport system permease protein